MDEKTTRMVFATAALAAVAAVLAGPAGAQIPEGDGGQRVASQSEGWQAQSRGDVVVRQAASQQGLDVAIRTAIAARSLGGVHAALTLNRHENGSAAPLPHGVQVVLSPPSESQSPGLSGDSPLYRVSAPEPEGLTGDGALTRVPDNTTAPTVSGGEDIDWTSFGAGAGMVALIAAGLAGVVLTARRRHTIGLP
jgi:hypothetical protein